jgi:hypothetical protein
MKQTINEELIFDPNDFTTEELYKLLTGEEYNELI